MKLAVITDSSASLKASIRESENLFVLDIPVLIDDQTYIEGKNLTIDDFYQKMAASKELPKTSQPSVAALEELLSILSGQDYTHIIGLFLSSGISGFYQNIQYLIEEFPNLETVFIDSKITSAPLGTMVENALTWGEEGLDFDKIVNRLERQANLTTAYIMVDDLDHLVKGGRLSNGAAILGNLLSIKPILYFNDGVIEVYEKIRTEKKAVKRLLDILQEMTGQKAYQITVLHAQRPEKAEEFRQLLLDSGLQGQIEIAAIGSVIGTHLGEGAIAFGVTPLIEEEA
ncbi:DegV family protein [Streptococcus oricebi]|uniref:EDD domain protein n=1 Tax=Streptococcus oricebi TaxID=1547447 RepID=A0ABS5B2W8_9STRE|nr:DegV family protein [Streptococcus oricebi]MBP2623169.1 EDD domain protein [Streptococcus oricebi]